MVFLGDSLGSAGATGKFTRAQKTGRLALFRQVLAAVAHAHHHLVVDRGIDAREAASAIREIDADLKRCNEAMARLGPA